MWRAPSARDGVFEGEVKASRTTVTRFSDNRSVVMKRHGALIPPILIWENFVGAAHRAAVGNRDRPSGREFHGKFKQNVSAVLEATLQGILSDFSRFAKSWNFRPKLLNQ